VPGVTHTQHHRKRVSSRKSSSSISSSATDDVEANERGPGEQTEQAVTLQRTRPSCPMSSVAQTYKVGPEERKTMKRPT